MLTVMSSPSLDTEHSDTVRTVSLTEEPLEQNDAKSCVPQNFKAAAFITVSSSLFGMLSEYLKLNGSRTAELCIL